MDDEQGREGRITMLYIEGNGFTMKLLKLWLIGVVHLRFYFLMSTPPEQKKNASLQDRNVYRICIYRRRCDDVDTLGSHPVARGRDVLSTDLGSSCGP